VRVIPVLVLVVGMKCLFTYLGSRKAVSNVPLERLGIKCFKRRNFFGVHSLSRATALSIRQTTLN